jgi:hypothetical protein
MMSQQTPPQLESANSYSIDGMKEHLALYRL